MKIAADRGCAWMLKKDQNGNYVLHVSDPSYSQQDIHLDVKLPGKASQQVTVKLANSGKYAGKTQKFVLN